MISISKQTFYLIFSVYTLQGDHSGSFQPPVDIKTKVASFRLLSGHLHYLLYFIPSLFLGFISYISIIFFTYLIDIIPILGVLPGFA